MTADVRERLQEALAGRYRLERELGRGGMATVFLAHDLRHDRPVALKVLHPDLAATVGPERFQREIRTTARLQHPHILPVLDSGDAAGQLWYTMPYVEGESLRDRLRRESQLPLDDALQIAREVADALGYAHAQSTVHRDVKPENILLGRGHALVADFGIARALQVADAEHLTATGVAVGTPAYMSPEQADGTTKVDGRSDLYSLGCVLFEMLTGETPYTGRTPQAIIAKRVLEPLPHVRTLRANVPEPLEQALCRALAVNPADRFATAADFARALAHPLSHPETTSSPANLQPTPAYPQWHALRRLVALALGVLLVVGVLLAWLRTRSGPAAAGSRRLAVLPFENLGRPDDEYFADGVTDEVRGKLAAMSGLEVIARTSSSEYKRTTKRPQQIGRELGVDYLLTGTVRWEKNMDGSSRVRVSPELIQVSTASTKWQEPFDAPVADVFRVQAEVATQVAQALGVALRIGERGHLAEVPTRDLAAYDAFLKGEATAGFESFEPRAQEQAIDYYRRAVTLDSNFALAWAKLSFAYSLRYWVRPTANGARAAREAAERAIVLAPSSTAGYLAQAQYYTSVAQDLARAFEYSRQAERLAPGDVWTVMAVATGELYLGDRAQALQHVRQAQVLDPLSVQTAVFAVDALVRLHRYPEARTAADRAVRLAPDNLEVIGANVMVHLAQGDLDGARSVLQAAVQKVDSVALVANIATWGDLYWVLDKEQQQLLLRLSAVPFGEDRAAWALALLETHALRGEARLATAFADSARLAYEARLRNVPDDANTRAYLGLALAYLGRPAEAIQAGERAVALMPVSRHPPLGLSLQYQLVRIYLLVGEREKALGLLEPLVRVPSYLSPGWLRIDPTFAPLRGDLRFERLVNGQQGSPLGTRSG